MAVAASVYASRIDEPRAVHLERGRFGVVGDGVADDTLALQQAINEVVRTTTRGIVLLPEGRYRISKTLTVWPGIRLIGYGATRPVILLGANTPGYSGAPAYLVHFAGNIPGHPTQAGFVFDEGARGGVPDIDFDGPVREANPGTFYSALSNIDLEIGPGNPAAVGVRSTFAQHCFIAHVEFRIGDGLAGIHDAGNLGVDLVFRGGRFGILTRTPSPGWPYALIDAHFEGQRVAGISSENAGLTLVRPQFEDMPTAILMHPERGEQLWLKDARMTRITSAALTLGNESSARNQVNVENLVAEDAPIFAYLPNLEKRVDAPGRRYRVKSYSQGLHVEGSGTLPQQLVHGARIETEALADLPEPVAGDIAPLPPMAEWRSVREFGAKGDGRTDDTAALREAIAAHRVLFFPMGAYRLTGTLALRPDTVLIGLHPGATRLFIADGEAAFAGNGPAVPLIETPPQGRNIVAGLGLYTNGANPRAAGAIWKAGEHSLMSDVRFLGGHGTSQLSGEPEKIYDAEHSGDPDPRRRWNSQYASLWIRDGGGGTFMNIWTPSPYAREGLLVTDTATPGRIYQMSAEHHVRAEARFERVANWDAYALQFEEEWGESGGALPLEIIDSRALTFANLFTYRVIGSVRPAETVVRIANSDDIRFRNFHWWTNGKADFTNAIVDLRNGIEVREREFAWLTLRKGGGTAPDRPPSTVIEPGAKLTRLTSGFHRLAGGAVDPAGNYYAVDARPQRIYRWTGLDTTPDLVSDGRLRPVNLATDRAGNLLIVSYSGKVYTLQGKALPASAAIDRPTLSAVVPQSWWSRGFDVARDEAPARAAHYLSPDATTFVAAGEDFVSGRLSWGVKDHDILRPYSLMTVKPGQRVYVTLEWLGKTYSGTIDAAGNLRDTRLFVERGGEAVAWDAEGRVYVADGEIFVYSPAGELLEIIAVPERPLGLAFGGEDRRTLYVPAGTSLYAVRMRVPGA